MLLKPLPSLMDAINSQMLYGGIDVTDYAALSFGCMYKNISGSTSIGVSTELDSPQQRTTLPTAEEIKQPLESDDGENGDGQVYISLYLQNFCSSQIQFFPL